MGQRRLAQTQGLSDIPPALTALLGRPRILHRDAPQLLRVPKATPLPGLAAKPPCQLFHGRPPLGEQPCQIRASAERRGTPRRYRIRVPSTALATGSRGAERYWVDDIKKFWRA